MTSNPPSYASLIPMPTIAGLPHLSLGTVGSGSKPAVLSKEGAGVAREEPALILLPFAREEFLLESGDRLISEHGGIRCLRIAGENRMELTFGTGHEGDIAATVNT